MKAGDLTAVLEKVEKATARRELIEQSVSFLFNKGRVAAFDGEVSVSAPSLFPEEVQGALVAEPIMKLLRSLEADMEITFTFQENEVLLSSSRVKAGFPWHELKVDLESIFNEPPRWQALPEGFTEMLAQVLPSASEDAAMPILTCVHVTPRFMECFDNLQLARGVYKKPCGSGFPSFCIQAKVVAALLPLGPKKVGVDESWAHFDSGDGFRFSSRLFDEKTYPSLEKILHTEGEEFLLPPELARALDRSKIFSSSGFLRDERVDVSLEKGWAIVSVKGDKGWYKERERVQSPTALPTLKFSVNPSFFAAALSKGCPFIKGDEKLKIEAGNVTYIICIYSTAAEA